MSTSNELRSADASLLGYHYQLDKAVLEILNATNRDTAVVIEGVEDVDVVCADEYRAIQCKYFAAQKCTRSVLREPIQLMLAEFIGDTQKKWQFRLYAHFKEPVSISSIDLSELKLILTYKKDGIVHRFHEANGISDEELEQFLHVFQLIEGPTHEAQQSTIFNALRQRFSVSLAESEHFYYPKALALILGIAVRKTRSQRTVKPGEMIDQMRAAVSAVASPWLTRILGGEKAAKYLKKVVQSRGLFVSTKPKALIIEASEIGGVDPIQMGVADFIEKLVDKSCKVRHSLYDVVPWTIVINATQSEMLEIKQRLLSKEIIFNDGYEAIAFSSAIFNAPPIVNRGMSNRKVTDKLERISYRIRLVRYETIASHLVSSTLGDALICLADPHMQIQVAAAAALSINIGPDWKWHQILKILEH